MKYFSRQDPEWSFRVKTTERRYLRTTSFFESHSQKIFDKVGGCVSGRTRTNSTPTPCCNTQATSNEDYIRGISYNVAPVPRFFTRVLITWPVWHAIAWHHACLHSELNLFMFLFYMWTTCIYVTRYAGYILVQYRILQQYCNAAAMLF